MKFVRGFGKSSVAIYIYTRFDTYIEGSSNTFSVPLKTKRFLKLKQQHFYFFILYMSYFDGLLSSKLKRARVCECVMWCLPINGNTKGLW